VAAGRDGRRPGQGAVPEAAQEKKFISKGEFAHDIALAIQDGQQFTVPAYLREAIASVVEGAGEPSAATAAQ
jgi:putative ATP-dependent endonuclease of OLD family